MADPAQVPDVERSMCDKPGFSRRTSWNTEETECGKDFARAAGGGNASFLDLTASNPTRCGFEVRTLRNCCSRWPTHRPSTMIPTRGECCARAHPSVTTTPLMALKSTRRRSFLSTSTSEAYSYLFRLLCDPGDEC